MLLLLIVSSMLCTFIVYGDSSDNNSKQTLGQASSTEAVRGTYLSEGTAEISKLSSDEVHLLGVTDCVRTSDKVYLYLYLEQKVNGAYGTYRTWKFTKQNADALAKGIDVLVPSGYYYRLRGYHAAECNGTKESVGTCTSGVWVD